MFTFQDPRMPKRNSHQERDDYDQEHIWSEAFEHLAVGVAQLTLDGKLLTANAQLCEIIGRPKRDLLEKNFMEFFTPERSWPEFKESLERLISGEIPNYSTNMSAVRPDGQLVWVNKVITLVRDDQTNIPRSMTAVVKEITLLKQAAQHLHDSEVARDELSRKMMDAQEADRSRIARELHDDIGQSLAVLKIEMLRTGQPVSGQSGALHPSLKELAGKLEKIIDKVSYLSHDLHSSQLELLGLTVAVKSHCRECSEQLSIPILCSCDEVEEQLDSMTALAFLRVLQEGLRNAVKHSRGTSITVRLTSSNHKLCLEIYDNGAGFDAESARLAPGLGLISMRERIHLIGGEFEISTSPGQGTRIVARAPIVQGTP
jgi:PAS domain S-box-containing protein